MTTRAVASDVAFTASVKAVQSAKGSRRAYAKMEAGDGWETTVTAELADFIAGMDSVFIATASAAGQPYVQHRGGPKGFLRVIDEHTLGFADYGGNRQYISLGNLAENPRVQLFLIDYAHRRRVKVWGEARVVEDDPGLVQRLMPEGYAAKGERAIVIRVSAWDVNCPQHIPVKLDAADVAAALATRDRKIEELEERVRELEGR
jgi:predicted pyridoxine 5'-phosphate oxidase superfamily flavin-nucleotide-binding protein